MNSNYPVKVQKLQQKIGYQFKNTQLLTQALTHRSYSTNNNERLEFLGDSVLGCVISKILFDNFPTTNEGKLTRMKANLVRGMTLTEIAKELEIQNYIILGASEKKSGGRHRSSNLEDVVEAIFGAIYLDSDFHQVEKIILNLYHNRLQNIHPNTIVKDDKTILQEFLQRHKKQLPIYELIATKGKDHNAIFTVKCTLPDYGLHITKEAKSIKRAEHACAKTLFPQLQNYE
jgi:ribonuclease-3